MVGGVNSFAVYLELARHGAYHVDAPRVDRLPLVTSSTTSGQKATGKLRREVRVKVAYIRDH